MSSCLSMQMPFACLSRVRCDSLAGFDLRLRSNLGQSFGCVMSLGRILQTMAIPWQYVPAFCTQIMLQNVCLHLAYLCSYMHFCIYTRHHTTALSSGSPARATLVDVFQGDFTWLQFLMTVPCTGLHLLDTFD